MAQKKRKVKILWDRVFIAAILFLILVLAIVLLITGSIGERDSQEADASTETTISSESGDSTESTTSTPDNTLNGQYEFITYTEEDVSKGNLIVVNSNYNLTTDISDQLTKVLDLKTGDYKVVSSDVALYDYAILAMNEMFAAFNTQTSLDDVMVSHGYRTVELQTNTYYDDSAVDENGYAVASKVAGGSSDLHTGLSFSVTLYPLDGVSRAFDGTGEYSWIEERAYLYGFILRYPEEKESFTGVQADVTQFRYVGLPHSGYIAQANITLEEYVEQIKEFRVEQPYSLEMQSNNTTYEVYYVPSAGPTTEVPVPKDFPYTVSGNNYDGFIVTVIKN